MADHLDAAAVEFLRDLAAEAAADAVIDLQWGMALRTMLADGWLVLRPGHYPATDGATVRQVNGEGPRCGCGALSRLHLQALNGFDYFLCDKCALGAVVGFIAAFEQPRFGPAAQVEYEGSAQ